MSKIRLEELLVEAEILTSSDLTEAIQVSKRLNVPIERVLLSSGTVRQDIIDAALEAQPLINEGRLEKDKVLKTLQKAFREGMPLDGIVDFEKYARKILAASRKLADLLIESGIVEAQEIEKAMDSSADSGKPLGTILVLEGIISPSLYPSISQIQENVHLGKISREDGVQQIKSTYFHWSKTSEADSRNPLENLLTDEIDSKLERNKKKSSESEQKISSGETPLAGSLRKDSLKDSLKDSTDGNSMEFLSLLEHAGCFSRLDLDRAYKKILSERDSSARFLLDSGLMRKELLDSACSVHDLYMRGELTSSEATAAIKEMHRLDLDNRLSTIGSMHDAEHAKKRRRQTAGKVLGGLFVGAALAGISIFGKSKGR